MSPVIYLRDRVRSGCLHDIASTGASDPPATSMLLSRRGRICQDRPPARRLRTVRMTAAPLIRRRGSKPTQFPPSHLRHFFLHLHHDCLDCRQSPAFAAKRCKTDQDRTVPLNVAQDQKKPRHRAGAVQQGGAYDDPHMRRELLNSSVILFPEYHFDLHQDSRVFLTDENCIPYATRRYPPDSVTSRRAFDGSGSIFWRNL